MMWYLRYSIRIRGFPRHQAAIHGCATEVGFAFQQDLWQTDTKEAQQELGRIGKIMMAL